MTTSWLCLESLSPPLISLENPWDCLENPWILLGINFDFLVQNEPFQGPARTPRARFCFSPDSPVCAAPPAPPPTRRRRPSPSSAWMSRDDGSGWLNLVGILADKISTPFLRRRDVHLPRAEQTENPRSAGLSRKCRFFRKPPEAARAPLANKAVRIPRL